MTAWSIFGPSGCGELDDETARRLAMIVSVQVGSDPAVRVPAALDELEREYTAAAETRTREALYIIWTAVMSRGDAAVHAAEFGRIKT